MKATTQFPAVVIESAQNYTERGFFVVPLLEGENHPSFEKWQDLRLDKEAIREGFADAAGVGILLEPSKLADVDLDCREAIAAADVLLPATQMIQGRRSNPRSHRYFRSTTTLPYEQFQDPCFVKNDKSGRPMLVELRTNGLTVAPPSINIKSGESIEWESDGEPTTIDGNELSRLVRQIAAAALLARYWSPGMRHFAALALAGMLLHAGWSEEATRRFILAICTAAGDRDTRFSDVTSTAARIKNGDTATGAPTLAEIMGEEIVKKVREWLGLDSRADGDSHDYEHHQTDLGNSRRLVELHGKNLRYCAKWKKWLVWNGLRWIVDESGEIQRLAKHTIESIHAEAGSLASGAAFELRKHALKSEGEARLNAMVELAKTEPGIPIAPDQLDADPWLLNCQNGTIDLTTGKLLPHSRENLCTKQVPIDFDAKATCPAWDAFLERIMAGKSALIDFLQRAVGYSLTGMQNEQILFFFYGMGANGKSTFIEIARSLLGDYSQQAEFSTFLVKKTDAPRNDLARLKGARFVAAVEAGEGQQLSETVIKQVTGGEPITARFLYGEFFEFTPQFKLFLVANHKPKIRGTDEAIWRRIKLIPFAVTIPRDERDKHLPDKLHHELAGILAWAVRGCLQWQENGMGEPIEVTTATDAYRREMDTLGDFIDEKCVVGAAKTADAGALYQSFHNWLDVNGELQMTQKQFGTYLRERGFESGKKRGSRCWFGLRLRADGDDALSD